MSEDESLDRWAGCYGQRVDYSELSVFLSDSFMMDNMNARVGGERFATCVWGHSGYGKTECIKQLESSAVDWRGKTYEGFDVRHVPIAQFEEMGDLHGMPCRHVLIRDGDGESWVPVEVVDGYLKGGAELVHSAGVRTMYAPPDWVPTSSRPTILILDDFNRAGHRIIKGCMQLLQNYGLMSWRLPDGCHIVLTANPDDQDYFVTSVDSATLQRLRSCTLKFNEKEWSVWASGAGIDGRVVSYVLKYPEMVRGNNRTSPRSLSEFGRYLNEAEINLGVSKDRDRMTMMAHGLLDDETVSSFVTFCDRDFMMITKPEDIMKGLSSVSDHMRDLMSAEEKRVDVVAVIVDRLFAHLCRKDVEPDSCSVKNVQNFICSEWLPEEIRFSLVNRLFRASEEGVVSDQWFLNNSEISKAIAQVL